jgi:hypothetical protein
MFSAVTRGAVIKSLSAAAIAALLVCALAAFSGAAVSADGGGESPVAPPDAAVAAPPLAGAPDGGTSRNDRRRVRHLKRFGFPGQTVDAGANVDAGAHDGAPMRLAARDAGVRPFVPPPPVVAPRPPPPPPPPQPTGPSTSLPVTEMGFNTCQKLPAGKRAVKINLKPDVELPELVAWISSITCKSFVLPGHLSAGGKKLTFVTQGTMTPKEAYATFLIALDSIGLTVEKGTGYYKIIETAKAKSGAVPVYGFDGKPAQNAPNAAKPSGPGD